MPCVTDVQDKDQLDKARRTSWGTHRFVHGGLVGAPGLRLQYEAAAGREQVIDARQQRMQAGIPAVQVHPLGHAQA